MIFDAIITTPFGDAELIIQAEGDWADEIKDHAEGQLRKAFHQSPKKRQDVIDQGEEDEIRRHARLILMQHQSRIWSAFCELPVWKKLLVSVGLMDFQ